MASSITTILSILQLDWCHHSCPQLTAMVHPMHQHTHPSRRARQYMSKTSRDRDDKKWLGGKRTSAVALWLATQEIAWQTDAITQVHRFHSKKGVTVATPLDDHPRSLFWASPRSGPTARNDLNGELNERSTSRLTIDFGRSCRKVRLLLWFCASILPDPPSVFVAWRANATTWGQLHSPTIHDVLPETHVSVSCASECWIICTHSGWYALTLCE